MNPEKIIIEPVQRVEHTKVQGAQSAQMPSIRLTCTKRANDWHVCRESNTAEWGCGSTIVEAIGQLFTMLGAEEPDSTDTHKTLVIPLEPSKAETLPTINIRCETTDTTKQAACNFPGPAKGVTYLNVIRVEQEDNGSFTAVTDHWPNDRDYEIPSYDRPPLDQLDTIMAPVLNHKTDDPEIAVKIRQTAQRLRWHLDYLFLLASDPAAAKARNKPFEASVQVKPEQPLAEKSGTNAAKSTTCTEYAAHRAWTLFMKATAIVCHANGHITDCLKALQKELDMWAGPTIWETIDQEYRSTSGHMAWTRLCAAIKAATPSNGNLSLTLDKLAKELDMWCPPERWKEINAEYDRWRTNPTAEAANAGLSVQEMCETLGGEQLATIAPTTACDDFNLLLAAMTRSGYLHARDQLKQIRWPADTATGRAIMWAKIDENYQKLRAHLRPSVFEGQNPDSVKREWVKCPVCGGTNTDGLVIPPISDLDHLRAKIEKLQKTVDLLVEQKITARTTPTRVCGKNYETVTGVCPTCGPAANWPVDMKQEDAARSKVVFSQPGMPPLEQQPPIILKKGDPQSPEARKALEKAVQDAVANAPKPHIHSAEQPGFHPFPVNIPKETPLADKDVRYVGLKIGLHNLEALVVWLMANEGWNLFDIAPVKEPTLGIEYLLLDGQVVGHRGGTVLWDHVKNTWNEEVVKESGFIAWRCA